jgi:hypothetical protein
MSWSFYKVTGRPPLVMAEIKRQASSMKMAEPEQSIMLKAVDIIEAALDAYPPMMPVQVDASGSQASWDGGASNQLRIEITPVFSFLDHPTAMAAP